MFLVHVQADHSLTKRLTAARMVWRWLSVLVASALLISSLGPGVSVAAAAGYDETYRSPRHYYLALGDSLAFGFQSGKFQQEIATGTYNPATFNTGYVDVFAAKLREIRPRIRVVNYSCPGETTATMIYGNCPFHNPSRPLALHNNYPVTVSQLNAAVAFLRQHRGQVSPITIDIGGNDVQNLFLDTCQRSVDCTRAGLPAVLGQVRSNLDLILTSLQRASPSSEIILLTVDNTYVVVPGLADASAMIVQALNATLTSVAAAHGVRVADGYTPISTPAQVCALTFTCSSQGDNHPNDAGYAVLADAVWAASGYARLERDDKTDGAQERSHDA